MGQFNSAYWIAFFVVHGMEREEEMIMMAQVLKVENYWGTAHKFKDNRKKEISYFQSNFPNTIAWKGKVRKWNEVLIVPIDNGQVYEVNCV